jgi:predicted MFS family arabinose efflux permease
MWSSGQHTDGVSLPDLTEATASPSPEGPRARSAIRSGLWHNRDFRVLLAGQGVSGVGDAISFTAVPLLVLALTGSGLQMGIVGVLQSLPDLLLGLPVGALADRWDRRRMMLFADLGRAVLTALIPLSMVLGLPTMAVVLAVTFPINVLRVFFMAAYTAAVPSLVGRDEIGPASSYFEAVFSVGWILGPAVAGLLAAVIGPGPTLAIDAATFAVSAVSLAFVRRPLQARTAPSETHILHDVREGIRFVLRHPPLRVAVACWGAFSLLTAPLIAVLTFYITVDRGLGPGSLGVSLSAFGTGWFVGSLFSARLTKRGPVGLLMLAGSAITGLMIAVTAFLGTLPLIAAAAFAAGGGGTLIAISYLTFRATVTPDELLGRVGTTARTLTVGIQPAGMLLGGILLDRFNGATTLLVIGTLAVAVAGVFSLSSTLRGARLQRVTTTA